MINENDRFGKLIALYPTDKRQDRCIVWHCKCDCGNEIDVKSTSLTSGNTKSCGCLSRETSRRNGINTRKRNEYDLSGEYGIGLTSKKEKFYFDIEYYDKIKDYTWSKNPEGYVISTPFGQILRMHILIMNPSKGHDIDHINHDVADNRKANLRECEHYQNIIATKTYSNNTSGRKGVYYDKSRNKWMAILTVNKKTINLGRFNMYDEAVKARENAERIYHKDFHYNEHEKG